MRAWSAALALLLSLSLSGLAQEKAHEHSTDKKDAEQHKHADEKKDTHQHSHADEKKDAQPAKKMTAAPKAPAGWKMRQDKPDPLASELMWADMPPGWHITTGPAAIFYDPAKTASGNFTVESVMFLFPAEHPREGYGIFLGGKDLEGGGQSYVYFLLRGDGQYLIKRRKGDTTENLTQWTPHTAILPAKAEGTAKNVLKAVVSGDSVEFHVNGEKVASLPRKDLDCDGVVGLRVNHAINLHVTSLNVTAAE